jgi:hypothetical protein
LGLLIHNIFDGISIWWLNGNQREERPFERGEAMEGIVCKHCGSERFEKTGGGEALAVLAVEVRCLKCGDTKLVEVPSTAKTPAQVYYGPSSLVPQQP